MFNIKTKKTVISSIAAFFGPLRANSLLIRSFPECEEIEHKNDCIRVALRNVIDDDQLFILKLEAIITLHSNELKKDQSQVFKLNRILSILNIKYDISKECIVTLNESTPLLLSKEELYIPIESRFIPDQFYEKIITEINVTYSVNCYSATMILLRKLFENLLIDILRKKFGIKKNKSLFWDEKRNQFHCFKTLIENFKSKIGVFKVCSASFDDNFVKFLDESIRLNGNISAHTIDEIGTKERLDQIKEKSKEYVALLFKTLREI